MSLNNPDTRYQELASKWLAGTITTEEKLEFATWYNADQNQEVVIPESLAINEQAHHDHLLANVRQRAGMVKSIKIRPLVQLSVAAAVTLLLLSTSIYFFIKQKKSSIQELTSVVADIAPGGDKATLTLGDGSVLKLDELANGSVKEDNEIRITKKDGELIYERLNDSQGPLTYNTIKTPRGGQFRVVLPDGSRVWLNAASSLQYPTNFNSDYRLIRLTGEGYFEIAKLIGKGKRPVPFRINVNNKEEVEVLGTHFNIMAYSEEKIIKTTLLEGSVRVSKTGTQNSSLLKPGQQSEYNGRDGFVVKTGIDPEESISWKNGLITFKDADIKTIMRQVERWYDVKVEYEEEIPQRLFTGGISRKSQLSSLLKVLELNNIHFKVQGKTIIVAP
jgi:transmembrane sensor